MTDDNFDPPHDGLADWRAKRTKWKAEQVAEARALSAEQNDVSHLIAPLMRTVAKLMHQELEVVRSEFMQEIEQLRREVRWVGQPKQRRRPRR
jgi:hypothetical protein